MKKRISVRKPSEAVFETDVVVFKDTEDKEGRFVAECLDLPGCISQGATVEEALENLKDAAVGYLTSLEKHSEPIPPKPVVELKDVEGEVESATITCHDCGTELRPDNPICPTCGSRNRRVIASNHLLMREMAVLKQKEKGFKKFKVREKLGDKVAGKSGRLAKEFLLMDKTKNLKCHVVAEHGESCRWRLMHFEICPLDPSDSITFVSTERSLPFELDLCTEKHIVLRGTQPPHPRLTIPRKPLSLGCARLLFAYAGLPPWDFGRILLAVQST